LWKSARITLEPTEIPSPYRNLVVYVEEAEAKPLLGLSEPVSSMSHLLRGVPLFMGLTVILLRRGGGHLGRGIALGLYGLANVVLFTLSGFYHLLPFDSQSRLVLQRLDHAAIFCL